MKRAVFLSLVLAGASTFHGPAIAQNGESLPSSPVTQWMTYRANPQRTNSVEATLGASAPNLLWRHSSAVTARSSDSSPLVLGPPGQHRIYAAFDNRVHAIDGQTGASLRSSKALPSLISSPLALLSTEAGDLILSVTNRGHLTALRASDLGMAWQGVPDENRTVTVVNSAPLVVQTPRGERIILALGTGKLIAFTPTGKVDPDWEVVLGGFAAMPTATPAVSEDGRLLYVPTQDKRIWVVNIETMRVEFPITTRSAVLHSPVVTEDHLVIVTGSTLHGLDLRTGRRGWVFDVRSELGAPAVTKNSDGSSTLYIGARNGDFYALNARTGQQIWRRRLGDSASSAPSVARDTVLVGTRNGMLYALLPETGEVTWRYRLHTERLSAPPRDPGPDRRFGDEDDGMDDLDDAFDRQPGFGAPGTITPGNVNPGNPFPGGFNTPLFGGAVIQGQPQFMPGGQAPGFDDPAPGNQFSPTAETDWKNPPVWKDASLRTHGVTSSPIILDGNVYLLGDNAALYSFTTTPFDALAPQLTQPRLEIPDQSGSLVEQKPRPDGSWRGPGKGPVWFIAEISDAGSGVDPESLHVSINGRELPPEAIRSFSELTGEVRILLTQETERDAGTLENGTQKLTINARDYRGNGMDYVLNLRIDNSARPPAAPSSSSWRRRFGF